MNMPLRAVHCRGAARGTIAEGSRDLVLRSTDFPKMKFHPFLLTPSFGHGLLPNAPKLWIDDLEVATERIGPNAAKYRAASIRTPKISV